MKLHPYLPTIVPVNECPEGEVYFVPQVEIVNIVAPDGTVLFENILYERRQTVMITGIGIPKEPKV